MNLKEKLQSIDWEAREGNSRVVPPATTGNQAALSRPQPETVEQQRQRVLQLRQRVIDNEIRKEQERIKGLKHHYVARINGRVVLAPGKPPTAAIGAFSGKAPAKRRSSKGAVTPVAGTGRRFYITPFQLPGSDDGVVMY